MDLWEDVRGLGASCLCGLKGKEVLLLSLCVAAEGVQAVNRSANGVTIGALVLAGGGKTSQRFLVLAAQLQRLAECDPARREFTHFQREFAADDCCTLIDAFWDLWQLEVGESRDWKLGPASVTLLCFGPEFENESGDHLRIDFGLDARFLPQKGADTRVVQENIRSLLHLVGDVDRVLAPDRRTLWSESGANFAEVLASTLTALDVN